VNREHHRVDHEHVLLDVLTHVHRVNELKSSISDMTPVSVEFYLTTSLLLIIFLANILHILYLIVYQHETYIKSIRSILLSSSVSSLIVSIWLLPFFYFRLLWAPDSMPWRLWSFAFHVVDAVQLYSLLLVIAARSAQSIFICFIWITPMLAYSPLLWLTSRSDQIDYAPYRRLTLDVPWWILPALYFSLYFVPIIISFVLSSVHIRWPLIYYTDDDEREVLSDLPTNEHCQDMAELTNLIQTVLNFQLDKSMQRPQRSRVSTEGKRRA
jgi:hypothetical protein